MNEWVSILPRTDHRGGGICLLWVLLASTSCAVARCYYLLKPAISFRFFSLSSFLSHYFHYRLRNNSPKHIKCTNRTGIPANKVSRIELSHLRFTKPGLADPDHSSSGEKLTYSPNPPTTSISQDTIMSEPRSPEPELKPAAEVDEQQQQQEAPPTPGGDAVSDEEPAKEVEAEAEPEAEEQQQEQEEQGEEEAAQDNGGDNDDDDDEDKISDDESILSEVDEAQFEDFDPENVDIEDRPQLAIDEDNLKLIGRHKRKRTEGGEEERSKRKREGRREKKSRRMRELEDGGASDEEKASRRRKKKEAEIAEEELLDPATSMFLTAEDGIDDANCYV